MFFLLIREFEMLLWKCRRMVGSFKNPHITSSPMVEIRRYQTTDYLAVKRILEAGGLFWGVSDSRERLGRKIQDDPDSILVAVEDERVVGTQFIITDFMPFLFRLAVHPEYRKRGIGTELMQRAEELLRERGHNHVNILVLTTDTKLQEAYRRKGYENGREYRWMTKEL